MNALLSPFRFLLLNRWPFALLAALFWMGACSGGGAEVLQSAAPDAIAAAEQLLASEPAEDDTRMLVFGPVSPGTTMSEGTDVVLEVPDIPGTYYLFVLDDEPAMKRGHAHRYAWLDADTGASSVVEAELLPTLDDPLRPEDPITLRGTATVAGVPLTHYTGTEPVGQDPGDKPLYGELQVVRQTRLANEPKRAALVADFGDSALMAPVAGKVSDDADAMGQWLTGEGFEVERISQFWGDQHPALGSDDRAKEFLDILKEYDDYFTRQPGEQHEFFLYLGAHVSRNERSFMIFDTRGKRDPLKPGSLLGFQRVAAALSRFPENVKITIFVDACYAGMMEEEALDAGLDQRGAGVTLIGASDVDSRATTGVILVDSATEDFLEDLGDEDGDGDVDIKDRADNVLDDSFTTDAFFRHWGNGDWGSLEKKAAVQAKVAIVRQAEGEDQVYVAEDGGERLLWADESITDIDVSQDGRFAVYEGAGTPSALRLVDLTEGNPIPWTLRDGGTDPCFSPNGLNVAYIDFKTGDLKTVRTDGTEEKTILEPDNAGVSLLDPVFSPDGLRIACWRKFSFGRQPKDPKVAFTDGSGGKGVPYVYTDFVGDLTWESSSTILAVAKNSPEVEPHASVKRIDVETGDGEEVLDGFNLYMEFDNGLTIGTKREEVVHLTGENNDVLEAIELNSGETRTIAEGVVSFELDQESGRITFVDKDGVAWEDDRLLGPMRVMLDARTCFFARALLGG